MKVLKQSLHRKLKIIKPPGKIEKKTGYELGLLH